MTGIFYRVVAISFGIFVDVGAVSAFQDIIAFAASECVRTPAAVDRVIAAPADADR